jgi:hypothetical protein
MLGLHKFTVNGTTSALQSRSNVMDGYREPEEYKVHGRP